MKPLQEGHIVRGEPAVPTRRPFGRCEAVPLTPHAYGCRGNAQSGSDLSDRVQLHLLMVPRWHRSHLQRTLHHAASRVFRTPRAGIERRRLPELGVPALAEGDVVRLVVLAPGQRSAHIDCMTEGRVRDSAFTGAPTH